MLCIFDMYKCKYFNQIDTAAWQRYAWYGYLACQWIHSFFLICFLLWHHAHPLSFPWQAKQSLRALRDGPSSMEPGLTFLSMCAG